MASGMTRKNSKPNHKVTMKKIILLFIMVFAVAGVQAKESTKIYATFGECTNSTYSDGTYTWTDGQNRMWLFPTSGLNLDVTKYQKLHVKVTDKAAGGSTGFKIRVFTGNAYSTPTKEFDYYSSTEVDVDLTSVSGTINRIDIRGLGTSGFKINETDVYLWGTYETMDITTTLNSSTNKTNPFQWYTSTDGSTKNALSSGNLYRCQFEKAGIKEILSNAGSNLGYGSGFFDVTGYDNVTVNIDTYDNTKADQIRLLQATGDKTTTNFVISVAEGATIVSLSSLTSRWLSGVYSKQGNDNCQAINSIEFTKEFEATSTTAFNIAASSSSTVNYDRTFNIGQKSTVCLPFALNESEVSAAGTFYELTSAAAGTLTFSEVSETEAYKPYVFEAKTANPFASLTNKTIEASADATTSYTVGGYTFQGTLAHQTLPSGVYGYNAANGAFSVTTTNAVTIDAFRGYITNGAGARELNCIFSDGETTGIETVRQGQQQDGVMYNLQGQRVGQGHKGLFIMNGRKYVVK